jgi:hypothetical protein
MSRSKLLRITLLVAAMAGPGTAFADGTPQTHHCKLADGTMDMKKTHKECTAAKGTWAQDPPKDASKAPPKTGTTPAPAPKTGTTPAPTPSPTPAPAPAPAPKK